MVVRDSRKRFLGAAGAFLCGLVILGVTGCGSGGALEPEASDFERLLMRVPYAAMDDEAFTTVFVDGAELDKDRKRYDMGQFDLESDSAGPEDNTRILKIVVKNSVTGETLGTVDWTAVKVGEEWRIKAAPLP